MAGGTLDASRGIGRFDGPHASQRYLIAALGFGAVEGGIGIVHKNLSPRGQAAEVAKVKRFESGVLKDPITVPPTMTSPTATGAA